MSYAPTFFQQGLTLSLLGSAVLLSVWSGTSMVVALAARALPSRIGTRVRLVAGLLLAGCGELALGGLSAGTGWPRLVPGLLLAGIGTGMANAALGRIAVASVPPAQAGMGSGANNTARYLGGAAGVALVVTVASATGIGGAVPAWNHAAVMSAGLCAAGAASVAATRLRHVLLRPGQRTEP
jgi:MFS family permease